MVLCAKSQSPEIAGCVWLWTAIVVLPYHVAAGVAALYDAVDDNVCMLPEALRS